MSDFPCLWEKTDILIFFIIFCDKSPLEDVKVHFKSKIALGVQYTPCDHEGLNAFFSNLFFSWFSVSCECENEIKNYRMCKTFAISFQTSDVVRKNST